MWPGTVLQRWLLQKQMVNLVNHNGDNGKFPLGMENTYPGHIVPKAVLGLKVVTMKTEGWVFTLRP